MSRLLYWRCIVCPAESCGGGDGEVKGMIARNAGDGGHFAKVVRLRYPRSNERIHPH